MHHSGAFIYLSGSFAGLLTLINRDGFSLSRAGDRGFEQVEVGLGRWSRCDDQLARSRAEASGNHGCFSGCLCDYEHSRTSKALN
jgi:hypothetical protein